MDVLALSLKRAAKMIVEDQTLQKVVDNRYGWDQELGQKILSGKASLEDLAKMMAFKG